jgi:hypothetical protein
VGFLCAASMRVATASSRICYFSCFTPFDGVTTLRAYEEVGWESWVSQHLTPPAPAPAGPLPTRQYGGETWWRPAVLRPTEAEQQMIGGPRRPYHGFFVHTGDIQHNNRQVCGPRSCAPCTRVHCINHTMLTCPPPCMTSHHGRVHYTSDNLTHWRFEQTITTGGYDTAVFRIKDRWMMLSSNGPPYESQDLFAWKPSTLPGYDFWTTDPGGHGTLPSLAARSP